MNYESHFSRCCPYFGNCTEGPIYKVGFAQETSLTIFHIFIFLGIIANLITLIHTIFFKMKIESQIGKYLMVISIVEICISVCWVINIFYFENTNEMEKKCIECKNYAILPTFLYLFSWSLILVTNKQLKKLITFELVKNDRKEIALTIIKWAILALIVSVVLAITKITGI